MKLEVSGLQKIYKNNDVEQCALKSFSYCFPSVGLVSICGKSGCGKTTLLNLLSLIDKPTSGRIMYDRSNTKKWKKNKIAEWRNTKIGMVFQHYNLLEQETVFDNLALPLLIAGKRDAKTKVIDKLKRFGFSEEILNKSISDMSGGERQRIAILRAIINEPEILFCDEPTGALDTHNSEIVMSLLKEISKNTLVIMVSHNQKIVKEYSDVIINMSDGKISSVEEINVIHRQLTTKKEFNKKNYLWNYKRGLKLIKEKPIKNLLTSFSILICLLLTTLIVGFIDNYQQSVITQSYHSIDYGVMTVTHQERNSVNGSSFSVIKESRPSNEEIKYLEKTYPELVFLPNITYFVPLNSVISVGEQIFDGVYYSPIYSFDKIDDSLLVSGRIPNKKNEVLVNKAALKRLENNTLLNVKNTVDLRYDTNDENETVITDLFIYNEDVEVVGVVDDFSFLSTPKIYYSYVDVFSDLKTTPFINLSIYYDYSISIYDYLQMSSDNSEISSYNYYCFYNDYYHYNLIDNYIQNSGKIVFYSTGVERKNACLDLISVCSSGAEIFLIIAVIGTVFIIGIISLSIFLEDRKKVAIITVLGAKESDILTIYLTSNIVIGLIALIVSLMLSPLMTFLLNLILGNVTGINGLIKLPFLSFLGKSFLFPYLLVVSLLFVIVISTIVPIKAMHNISLREELANND